MNTNDHEDDDATSFDPIVAAAEAVMFIGFIIAVLILTVVVAGVTDSL